jgi:ABC-type glycerol-3-phosphate transport system permease component
MKVNPFSFLGKTFRHLIFIIISIITLFPIYYIFTASLKGKKDYLLNNLGIPQPITFENFKALFTNFPFFKWFSNSLLITSVVVILGTLICCFAAYGFARFNFKFKQLLIRFLISFMLIPPIVVLIPLFEFFVKTKLISNFTSIITIYIGFIIPFTIYLVYNFFVTVPTELIDAAKIDGSSNLGILFRIFIPLSMPAIITSIVVNAFWVWNELLMAMVFLQRENSRTLMAGLITFKSRSNIDLPLTMAGLLTATIPIILLFLFSQRFFTKGLMSGIEK